MRVAKSDAAAASAVLEADVAAAKLGLSLEAISKGAWANKLLVDVDHSDDETFNLTITDRLNATHSRANFRLSRVEEASWLNSVSLGG